MLCRPVFALSVALHHAIYVQHAVQTCLLLLYGPATLSHVLTYGNSSTCSATIPWHGKHPSRRVVHSLSLQLFIALQVSIDGLRSVPLDILKRLDVVPAAYLQELGEDRELFAELPAAVQRQVGSWLQAPQLSHPTPFWLAMLSFCVEAVWEQKCCQHSEAQILYISISTTV